MATRTISNAGGNWNALATWVEGAVPTAADEVVATATSGPLTINVTANCRSINLTNYTGTLTHAAGVQLQVGDGTAGTGNVALKFVAGMTYTVGNARTSSVSFQSSVTATPQTITTAAKTFGDAQFSNGSFKFLDGFNTGTGAGANVPTVILTSGTLDTNSQNCSWGAFSASGTTARTLTLGTSVITITGVLTTVWSCGNATALTISGASSTIHCDGGNLAFAHGNITNAGTASYGTVTIGCQTQGTMQLGASPTFVNLAAVGTAAKTDTFQLIGAGLTVSGTLTLTGNSVTNRLLVITDAPGTTRTMTAAVVALTNVDFMDITGAGAASPFTGTSLGDCQGTSGITFTVAATQTFAGGVKNWSDSTAWSTRVPLPQDNVTVNTVGGTLTVDMPRLGKNIDFTGFTGTLSYAQADIFGSITFSAAMTKSGGDTQVQFLRGRGAHTIKGAGKQCSLQIVAPGGTYSLLDDIIGPNNINFGLQAGTLDGNGFGFQHGGEFRSLGSLARTVKFGSGTWLLGRPSGSISIINFGGTNLTVVPGTALIQCDNTFGTTKTFAAGGFSFPTFKYVGSGGGNLLFQGGDNTFATLDIECTVGCSVTFAPGTTQTVTGTLTLLGAAAPNRLLVTSGTLGSQATLNAAVVAITNTDFTDMAGAGAAAPFTGTSLGNALGNTGITFTASATQTFQGGTKNWSDITAWTSRVPLPQDDVIVNSGAGGTITGDVPRIGRNINFTGYTGTWSPGTSLFVFGNLTLASTMTYSSQQLITLSGRGAQTLTSAGRTNDASWEVAAPGGTYTLVDDLVASGTSRTFTLRAGTFDDGGHNVSIGNFNANLSLTRALVRSGIWTLNAPTASWDVRGAGLTFTDSGAQLVFSDTSSSGKVFAGGGYSYGTLRYVAAGSGALLLVGSNTFVTLDIECTTARTITFPAGGTQRVTGAITLQGAAGQLLSLVSSAPGTGTTINASGATPSVSYTTLSISADVSLITTIGKSLALAYSDLVLAGASCALPYKVLVVLGSSRAFPYAVLFVVGRSDALPYKVLVLLGKSIAFPSIVFVLVGSSRACPYGVLVLLGSSRACPYKVLVLAGRSDALLYSLISQLGKSVTLPSTVLVLVGSSRSIPYAVLVLVGLSRSVPYMLLVLAGRSLGMPFKSIAQVGRSLVLRWHMEMILLLPLEPILVSSRRHVLVADPTRMIRVAPHRTQAVVYYGE